MGNVKQLVCFVCTVLGLLCSFHSDLYSAAHKKKNNPPPPPPPVEKYELVICAVFQNEDFFLKEWIEFHKLMGVQHFYLYNNLSTDQYLQVLQPYIAAGEVELFDWPIEVYNQSDYLHHLQIPVYKHALQIVKETAKWAAFIDLDEFLFPVHHPDLVSLLKEYGYFAGLVVNWQAYGTGGVHALPPFGLITESLVWKAPTEAEGHHMVKSIVQPLLVADIVDPHSFFFIDPYFAANSNGVPIKPGSGRHPFIAVDKVRINHYWFGTRDWFVNNKIPRRTKWGLVVTPESIDPLIATCNQVKDEAILRFTPQLRQKMYPGTFPPVVPSHLTQIETTISDPQFD
jgi:hypothetical protein